MRRNSGIKGKKISPSSSSASGIFSLAQQADEKRSDSWPSVSTSVSLYYLVIAGGGGGGDGNNGYGGGGGAGGYRSSWNNEASGGGGSAETPISLTANDVYTITIGAGGNADAEGSNSSIARSTGASMTTITSIGGGRGELTEDQSVLMEALAEELEMLALQMDLALQIKAMLGKRGN